MEVLKKHYWVVKEIFKYQSAIGTSSGSVPFAIPLNFYTEFVKNTGALSDKDISISQSDTLFLMINKRSPMTPLNPGHSFVRFQFLEILMRLGLKKDLIYKELDARINNFMCKYICPQLKVDKAQDYRWKRYWNEPVDNLYKFHMKLFQEVYKNYSGTLKLPGEENYMGASEFEKIWTDSKLQNDRFANRDMNVCFNLAMQTRVDEYNAYRHIKMTFIEFLEAFARAADYLSYPPASVSIHEEYLRTNTNELEKPEENNYEDDEEDVTLEEMISQPLSKKIENILPYVLNN